MLNRYKMFGFGYSSYEFEIVPFNAYAWAKTSARSWGVRLCLQLS
jgi:hypothetical protein